MNVFPTDVINVLTEYLEGLDICNLYLTGPKKLRYNLTEGGKVRKMVLRIRRVSNLNRWPTLVHKFKHLQVLVIDIGSGGDIRGNANEEMRKWPKGLRELRLIFRDAERMWLKEEAPTSLFPELKYLQLGGWSKLTGDALRRVSTNLETLNLSQNENLSTTYI